MLLIGPTWIGAPFLREISGQDLFQVLTVIKQEQASGTMELAISAGVVEMLHFEEGKPREGNEKIAVLCRRDALVVAWMPGRPKTPAGRDEDTLPPTPTLEDALHKALQTAPAFRSGAAWAVVTRRTEIVACSSEQIPGLQSIVGLVAEINGTFSRLLDERHLERACIATNEHRYGMSLLGGPWMVVYRIAPDHQADLNDTVEAVRDVLRHGAADVGEDAFRIASRAGSKRQTEYVRFRPRLYEPLQRSIQQSLALREHTWVQTWFRPEGQSVVAIVPRSGEPRQELDGDFEALVAAVTGDFGRVVGHRPVDMVLHADGSTLWCVFGTDGGFIANRFDTRELIYKWLAHDLAGSVQSAVTAAG